MPDINLNVDLKVDKALAELKRLGPGADKEAKAIAASLGKVLRDAEKDAKKLGDTTVVSGAKAAKAMGPLGGVLAKISPAAGSASAAIAGMTSAAEGFMAAGMGPAVAAMAVLLGGAALAWEAYNADANEAAAIAATLKTAHDELEPSLRAARLAEIDLAVATKQITAEAGRLEREGVAAIEAFSAATKTAQARIKEINAGTGSWSRTIGDLGESLKGTPLFGLGMEIDAFTTSTSEADAETSALMGTIQTAHAVIKRTTTAHTALAAATAEGATAEEAAAKAAKAEAAAHAAAAAAAAKHAIAVKAAESDLAALNAEMERAAHAAEANARGYNEAITSLQSMQDTSKRAMATDMDRLALDRDAAFAKSEALAREASTYASTVSARETIDAQRRATDIAAEAEYQDAVEALQAKSAADRDAGEQQEMAQRLSNQQAMGAAFISLGDSIVAATSKQHDTTTIKGRKAALAQFAVQKGVMLAQATIAGALAVSNALASPAGPPVSYVLAGVAGVMAAVEIGTIAATQPSFHRGYAPDETQARVLKRESVLTTTATAAVGSSKVAELNAGVTTGGGYGGPAPIVVGHRVFDDLVKRELRSTGALSTALAVGSTPGHRTNRRGTTG